MRPAKVYDYETSHWGQYKVLVDGEMGQEVTGGAFYVSSADQEYKLAYYETNTYELAPCNIHFTNEKEPSEILGKTFMYAGDVQVLKDGRFDPFLWEVQVGERLPPEWGRRLRRQRTTDRNEVATC